MFGVKNTTNPTNFMPDLTKNPSIPPANMTDPAQLLSWYSSHGITGTMAVGSNQVWKVEDTSNLSVPPVTSSSSTTVAPAVNLTKLTNVPVSVVNKLNIPQTNTASVSTSGNLDTAVLNSFIKYKPEAIDWDKMMSNAVAGGQEQAQRDVEVSKIANSPASVLGSWLSFHDPLGLRTLFYGGEVAVAKLLGNKNLESSARTSVLNIREGYVTDVASQNPILAGLEKGAEAGIIIGSVTLLPSLPEPIHQVVTLGYEGIAVAKAVQEPTAENIFFATLPLATYGLSKAIQGLKSITTETGISEEYYSDYGSLYLMNKEGAGSSVTEVKLLGGRLDEPLPEENYDVAVLLSEKKPVDIFGGGVTSFLSNAKFRIDSMGIMNPLNEEFGDLTLNFPKGYKGATLSLGTGEAPQDFTSRIYYPDKNFQGEIVFSDNRIQLWNEEFINNPISSPIKIIDFNTKVTLDVGNIANRYASILEEKPLASELRSGSAEDMFNYFYGKKLEDFMTGSSESVSILKLNVEPSSKFQPLEFLNPEKVDQLIKMTGDNKGIVLPKEDVLDVLGLRKFSGGSLNLAEGKFISLETEIAEGGSTADLVKLLNFQPSTYIKKVPFETEVIRYPYSNFNVGSIPNFMSSPKQNNILDILSVSFLDLKPDVKMKANPELVEALKPKEEQNTNLRDLLLPKINIIEGTSMSLREVLVQRQDILPALDIKPVLDTRLKFLQELTPNPEFKNVPLNFGGSEDQLGGGKKRSRTAEMLLGSRKKHKRSEKETPVATWENVMITEMLFGGKALQPKITKKTTREFAEEFNQPAGFIAGRFSTQSGRKEPKQISERIAKVLGLRRR